MARKPPKSPPTEAELHLFVTEVTPWLRLLASRWGSHDGGRDQTRWGIPGRMRKHLRRLADRAESLLRRR